ncbi:hypothetical protein IEQ34_014550 [Dendrobium chrysotoxum]|uniref:Uncharacterized protein n=1 Tax=Dendrobium chrysotoxum TaxID=161865 RepID=A0AAV7GLT7_DENCH|nr:hypothetical protein IEQ34_014550 [Dendrobium chrysotoxum]
MIPVDIPNHNISPNYPTHILEELMAIPANSQILYHSQRRLSVRRRASAIANQPHCHRQPLAVLPNPLPSLLHIPQFPRFHLQFPNFRIYLRRSLVLPIAGDENVHAAGYLNPAPPSLLPHPVIPHRRPHLCHLPLSPDERVDFG